MKQLYEKYSNDLEILAFPCNDFGAQEPGTNEEILAFAKEKGATFPILGKVDCQNKLDTDPFFVYLSSSLPNGITGQALKWNFCKFLCDKDGFPIKRYAPTSGPLSFEKDIIELIKAAKK